MLSFMLLDGEMVEQDFLEARRWAEAAAAKGHAGLATRLGSLFYDAHGTERDTALAVHWWRVASDGGDADGAALHLGQGVKEDQEDALRLLLLAEHRGSLIAARYLGPVRSHLETVHEAAPDAAIDLARFD